MSRQEKNSRVRMLPPRVQLQQRGAMTGSYPTNVRFSTDGRTGNYQTNYNDIYTVIFTSSNDYIPAVGFPVGNIWLTNSQSNDLTGSIITTGSVRPEITDGLPFFHFTPGQDITPFRDSDNPAVDGKTYNNSFYATGSAVQDIGEGFTSPLWSKNKIEIDFTPSETHEVAITNTTGNNTNFPMMYWNKNTKLWEGIGLGKEFDDYTDLNVDGLKKLLQDLPIGFATSILGADGLTIFTISNDSRAGYLFGSPVSNFGFPTHAKFHGSSSNEILMSDYITEPFLLEKIVLYVSAALDCNNLQSDIYSAITTFFILNQRKISSKISQEIEYYADAFDIQTFITGNSIPQTFNQKVVNTSRDLISFMHLSRIPFYPPPDEQYSQFNTIFERDYNYSVGDDIFTAPYITQQFSSQLQISSSIKNPIEYQRGLLMISNAPTIIANTTEEFHLKWNSSGRTANLVSNGRDFLNSIESAQIAGATAIPAIYAGSDQYYVSVDVNIKSSKVNPYLLLPTDSLIFGWQLPLSIEPLNKKGSNETYNGKGPSLTFSNKGINKIVLYGSYVRENKEYNDGTNQLLSSDSIHEVIE